MSGLRYLLKRDHGFFHRVFVPAASVNREGRALLIEFALYVFAFLGRQSEYSQDVYKRQVLLHRPDIFLPGLRDALDLRGQNVFKHIFLDIALALYAEGGHAVAGHLSQKGAGHPLDAKGKACVLNRALVSDLRQHFHKGGGFFRRKPFIDFILSLIHI